MSRADIDRIINAKKEKEEEVPMDISEDDLAGTSIVKQELTSSGKLESISSPSSSKKKKKRKTLTEDDIDKIVNIKEEEDALAEGSIVKQELTSSCSLESISSPSSKKKKKKRQSLTKDDIDKIVNTKKEVSIVKQEMDSPSTPNSNVDSPCDLDLSSGKKKKKKHKHSKMEASIKQEVTSGGVETPKVPRLSNTHDMDSIEHSQSVKSSKVEIKDSSSVSSPLKKKKKNSNPSSISVKAEHHVETKPRLNSGNVKDNKLSAKSNKKHDKLKGMKSPVPDKMAENASLSKNSTLSSSSDEKKAKKRKHSKSRSESDVSIKMENMTDEAKKKKLNTSNRINTPHSSKSSSKSKGSKHGKKKKHSKNSKVMKHEKNKKHGIKSKKIKVEKR